MKHQNPELHAKAHPMSSTKIAARDEFLKKAQSILENSGGYALLNGHYALIDTRVYEAKLKDAE